MSIYHGRPQGPEYTLFTLVRRKSMFRSPLDITGEILKTCSWYRYSGGPTLGKNNNPKLTGSINEMKRLIWGMYSPEQINAVEPQQRAQSPQLAAGKRANQNQVEFLTVEDSSRLAARFFKCRLTRPHFRIYLTAKKVMAPHSRLSRVIPQAKCRGCRSFGKLLFHTPGISTLYHHQV